MPEGFIPPVKQDDTIKVGDWVIGTDGKVPKSARKVISIVDHMTKYNDTDSSNPTPNNGCDLKYLRKALPHEIPLQASITSEPNMLEIQAECKKRFPIGSTVIPFGYTREFVLTQDDTIYHITEDCIYSNELQGCLYKRGVYAKLVSLPKINVGIDLYEQIEYLSTLRECYYKSKKGEIDPSVTKVASITMDLYKPKKVIYF